MSTETAPRGKAQARRPDLDTLYCVNEDGSRNFIHTADVRGRFQTRKRWLWILLISTYVVMPWIEINGNPAILIDIASRHFYLFGNTYNAQDFWLAFFYLTGLGFTLFVVSALFGRIWCGYACPQTVFLEGVFRRVERWIEGNAQARERLQKAPWSGTRLLKVGGKHAVYLTIALLLSHTFLSYFMPVEEVFAAVTGPPTDHFTAFAFVMVFTGIIYFNFTWFREQLCIVICPYGRLQGVLYDPDTVNVGYDEQRGEPRGKYTREQRGDCIDCYRCVAVCPTGIDIRNGTQLECVGCANCVDACDAVMDKLGQPRGLVRYDSQRGFETGQRRFWRPRVAVYAVLLLIGLIVFLFAASSRTDVEANLLRLPGPAYFLEEGTLRNQFQLHLVNKLPEQRTFTIEGRGSEDVDFIIPVSSLSLESLADARPVVMVVVERVRYDAGVQAEVVVRSEGFERVIRVPLAGPRKR